VNATPTRTLNPLPFHDLEPHRFEDLVRQLAYDLRLWKSLEAVGRLGSDEGTDIRGVEVIRLESEPDDDEPSAPDIEERLWIFQCKREKTLAPKKIATVVEESLGSLPAPPYGFVLAVACDLSKKARDVFRKEMVARGIDEFAIWSRGELEDMLFQAKNDRLLFAYFGLSLQPRRRTVSATLRTRVARKKQLEGLLEGTSEGKLVLLRDPTDERYPDNPKEGEPPRRWLPCFALSVKLPSGLLVLLHEFHAAVTPDGQKWDAIFGHDLLKARILSDLRGKQAWVDDEDVHKFASHSFWSDYIPEDEQAYLKEFRVVPLDRIVAIDPIGDFYFPVPHLFVEDGGSGSPFAPERRRQLSRPGTLRTPHAVHPDQENRARIFPDPLPADDTPIKEFDDTGNASIPLSPEAKTALADLLQEKSRSKTETPSSTEVADDTRTQNARIQTFREWRENVARPLFSTLVHQLRGAGHAAHVIVRSVDDSPNRLGGAEYVELRVRLRTKDGYLRSLGYLRISLSPGGRWSETTKPSPEGGHGRPSEPPVEQMVAGQLELRAVEMLRRLGAQGY
jgi:hypothetical protein